MARSKICKPSMKIIIFASLALTTVLAKTTTPAPPTTTTDSSLTLTAKAILSGTSADSAGTAQTTGSGANATSTQSGNATSPTTAAPTLSPSLTLSMLISRGLDTSILCKHLRNLTDPHPTEAAENIVEEESIEAKCFPGFVCVNGFCTGGMSCKCYDGWAGLFCQAECPKNCTPEGRCVTSTGNHAICLCNETSVFKPGVGCVDKPFENKTSTIPPSTTPANLRTKSQRECFGAFTCVHGYCYFGTLQCECDPGWKGQLCDQPCEVNCGAHGRCRVNDNFIEKCECNPSYEGEFCQISLNNDTATSSPLANTTRPETREAGDSNLWYLQNMKSLPKAEQADAIGANTTESPVNTTVIPNTTESFMIDNRTTMAMPTTLRPLSERECLPGFKCEHGYCSKEKLGCVCDPNWGGGFCTLSCELSCGYNGTCVVDDGIDPYCKCDLGYDGDLCEYGPGRSRPLPNDTHPSNATATTTARPVFTPNISDPVIMDPWEPLYGPLAPLAMRSCQPGFICAYGNCSFDAEEIKCSCEDGFTDVFCQTHCPLDCGEYGRCQYNALSDSPECYCFDHRYTGVNCTELRPEEPEAEKSKWWAVGLAVALVVLLALLLVVLPYVLWRKRNIAMMKFVYWFQPFEEDDDRQYDAFVSYASADWDRQFVIQTLVPKLEGRMCFTLCIHQRNFVPGLYITDNITESVKRSRRTLLVISPSFIDSGWCKFEYQMALQEMLNQKHRILPILIGDVSHLKEDMDDTLKSILNTVTWLEYPGKDATEQEYEKFWKRLALSMPKKRPSQTEENVVPTSPSCLTPTSTSPSSLDSIASSDPKAPLELRSFNNGNPKSIPPLKQIVRVPAAKLDSTANGTTSLAAKLNKFLGRSKSDDSSSYEGDSPGSSPAEPYNPLSQSEPSTPENGFINGSVPASPISNGVGMGQTPLADQIWNGADSGYSPAKSPVQPLPATDQSNLDATVAPFKNYTGELNHSNGRYTF